VCGDLQTAYLLEVGMDSRVELITEKLLDILSAIVAWWKTDTVNHQQIDRDVPGPLIAIG